jgi:hypothetical protein
MAVAQRPVADDDGMARAMPSTRSASDGPITFDARTGAEFGDGKLPLLLAVAVPNSLTSLRFKRRPDPRGRSGIVQSRQII